MVERTLKPCPLCAEIEGEELPRELQDVVDDLYGLLRASEERAKKATDPEEEKRHYLAAGYALGASCPPCLIPSPA